MKKFIMFLMFIIKTFGKYFIESIKKSGHIARYEHDLLSLYYQIPKMISSLDSLGLAHIGSWKG